MSADDADEALASVRRHDSSDRLGSGVHKRVGLVKGGLAIYVLLIHYLCLIVININIINIIIINYC